MQHCVQSAADKLNAMGGQYRSSMLGNAAFFKVDVTVTPRHFLSMRVNTSRYNGVNNVYLDPSSPITTYAVSDNGSEQVATESGVISLTSGITNRLNSHLRAQFSRDLQSSTANSEDVLTKIYNIMDGFGRATILPRRTREHKLHVSETFSVESPRQSWKFGGDVVQSWTSQLFPRAIRRRVHLRRHPGESLDVAADDLRHGRLGFARLCARYPALLHAELRYRGVPSRQHGIRGVPAGLHSRDAAPRIEFGRALRPANSSRQRGSSPNPLVPQSRAGAQRQQQRLLRASVSPTPWVIRIRW